jgi:hypothetical protein
MTHLDDGADLRAVMERSVHDLAAPDHCGPAALATGRRLRTRRRVAASLTGLAAAVVAAVTLPAIAGSGDANSDSSLASDPTPTPAPSPSAIAATEWWTMPSTRMVEELERILPAGVDLDSAVTTVETEKGTEEGFGVASGVLTGPTGPGSFQLLLRQPDLPIAAGVGGEPTPMDGEEAPTASATATATSQPSMNEIKCRAYHDTCQPIRDADGVLVGRVSSTTEQGTLLYEAVLLGPDAGVIHFTVMNSSGEKPGYEAPSSEVPPLTMAQLRALAEDPVWTAFRP